MSFDDSLRATLGELADVLIPAAGEMPAATGVDTHGRWMERVLAARPDIEEELTPILNAASGRDPNEFIARLTTDAPEQFELLLYAVAAAYYMSPKVRKRLGYPGQTAQPFFPDEAEYYLRDGLLAPVLERGPIYTPTDYRPDSGTTHE